MKQKIFALFCAVILFSLPAFTQIPKQTRVNPNKPLYGQLNVRFNIDNNTLKNPIQNQNTVFVIRCYEIDAQGHLGAQINAKITFMQYVMTTDVRDNGGGTTKTVPMTVLPVIIENLPLNKKFIVSAKRVFVSEWQEPHGCFDLSSSGFYLSQDAPVPNSDFSGVTMKLTTATNPQKTFSLQWHCFIH